MKKRRALKRAVAALISCVMLASFTLAASAGKFVDFDYFHGADNYIRENYKAEDGWVRLQKWDYEEKTNTHYLINDELGVALLEAVYWYANNTPDYFEVPDSIDGYPVVKLIYGALHDRGLKEVVVPDGVNELGDWSFGRSYVESISLPDGLERIGSYAFWRDTYLREIDIPDSVTEVGEFAFEYCFSLTDAKLPANLTEIPDHLFNISGLEHVNIPDGVKTIGDYAFNGCTKLAEITIPDGVEKIGEQAFCGCQSVKKVVLPDSVNELGWHAFRDMPALEEVELSSSLETVAPGAFADCPNLEAVVIPEGVKNIGQTAFGVVNGDKYHPKEGKLFAVVLPSTIESIDRSAFRNNGNLTIYYGGTEEQWESVAIADENDEILNANIVFLGDETGNGPAEGDPVEPVEEIIAGDVNGDGIVNSKDLTRFMKYLAGQDVTVVEEALDVTGDGSVNTKDLIRLLKFLSGEIVDLG